MGGSVVDTHDVGDEAVPGRVPVSALERGRLLSTLDVDGQVFDVRRHGGGPDDTWVNGPNENDGFSATGGRDALVEHREEQWHRESIRDFLAMVDPATGHIKD